MCLLLPVLVMVHLPAWPTHGGGNPSVRPRVAVSLSRQRLISRLSVLLPPADFTLASPSGQRRRPQFVGAPDSQVRLLSPFLWFAYVVRRSLGVPAAGSRSRPSACVRTVSSGGPAWWCGSWWASFSPGRFTLQVCFFFPSLSFVYLLALLHGLIWFCFCGFRVSYRLCAMAWCGCQCGRHVFVLTTKIGTEI